MRRKNLVLSSMVTFLVATGSLLCQDTTRSFYFPRAAFGAGSTSAVGSCNTGSEAVTEEVIFREADSGEILHTDIHLIPAAVCNVSILQDGEELKAGFVETRVTGPEGFQVIGSLLMRLQIGSQVSDEVRINPEEPTLSFTVNFSETPEARNGVAIADAGGTGFSCSAVFRDGSLFGSAIQGSPVQAGANQEVGLFFDEIFDGMPDAFGWARFDCDSQVVAMTLGQNTVNGNLAVGRVFPLPASP